MSNSGDVIHPQLLGPGSGYGTTATSSLLKQYSLKTGCVHVCDIIINTLKRIMYAHGNEAFSFICYTGNRDSI